MRDDSSSTTSRASSRQAVSVGDQNNRGSTGGGEQRRAAGPCTLFAGGFVITIVGNEAEVRRGVGIKSFELKYGVDLKAIAAAIHQAISKEKAA